MISKQQGFSGVLSVDSPNKQVNVPINLRKIILRFISLSAFTPILRLKSRSSASPDLPLYHLSFGIRLFEGLYFQIDYIDGKTKRLHIREDRVENFQ